MQVTSAQPSSSWSPLALLDRQATPQPADTPQTRSGDTAPNAAPEADIVSLHADARNPPTVATHGLPAQPSEVFAEIWKDGTKIGEVYTDGEAALPAALNGMAAGSNNIRFPYLRAEEISRQVGGEVRYVNIPALQVAQTRAQLRAAYGG